MSLAELERRGFSHISQWSQFPRNVIIELPPIAHKEPVGGWLYAFVVDARVQYVGETGNSLTQRMTGYCSDETSSTNRGKRLLICQALADGLLVDLFARTCPDWLLREKWEKELIRIFDPPWNLEERKAPPSYPPWSEWRAFLKGEGLTQEKFSQLSSAEQQRLRDRFGR